MGSRLLPKNEGATDRILRVVLGAVLLSLVFIGPQSVLGWIGLVVRDRPELCNAAAVRGPGFQIRLGPTSDH